MAAYYNEIDPYAAQWLRNLIARGYIAAGEVDERSVVDVTAGDLRGFVQAHFFAGIGGWSYALRLAGWPDTRPVWTGSCPCQSLAGINIGRQGFADRRHLWPTWANLIEISRPTTVFGEQVAGGDGPEWLARVRVDMEAMGYAFGAANLAACGVSAPQKRERLWFVALGDSEGERRREGIGTLESPRRGGTAFGQSAISISRVLHGAGAWADGEDATGRDGKRRRVKPGTQLLAYGLPERVARCRGFGNAIVPQVAAKFIAAATE